MAVRWYIHRRARLHAWITGSGSTDGQSSDRAELCVSLRGFQLRCAQSQASYLRFFMHYFTWCELFIIAAMSNIYIHLPAVDVANIIAFWAGPALVSSLQLFTFWTYLPHRPEATAFNDHHRNWSNSYPWWLSLLTCFQFGYHHEHCSRPDLLCWRLPAARTNRA